MAGKLVIDYKINQIINEIQACTKDVNGKYLTRDTIINIIESQIVATVDGMANGHTVIWKYLGTFAATKRRVDMLNKAYEKKGKTPTLQDTGLVRMSFKRNGDVNGTTDLFFPQHKRDILEPPTTNNEDTTN